MDPDVSMPTITVLDGGAVEVEAGRHDDHVVLTPAVLDRPLVVDLAAGVAALGAPRAERRRGLTGTAPSFTLPDLDGSDHDLEEWHDRKRVLIAFASW